MRFITFLLAILLSYNVLGQQSRPDGGGGYTLPPAQCVSEEQRQATERMLKENREMLRRKGMLKDSATNNKDKKTTSVMMGWPLHQVGVNYYSYYGIANFVDHDTTYPNHTQDWNCGHRTYDLSTGYNHAGTDIFLWPFSWNMMEAQDIEIVAAAPGTIIGKYDGNFDHNCAMSTTANWNAVYIQHSDGTVAWYGHMKTGTPTSKAIGDTVALGEHLGFVGSSGSSTGPHLHFELHDAAGRIRDPYSGTCNAIPSLWSTPRQYYESQVNIPLTHSSAPVFETCPTPDIPNTCDTFLPGNTIYFATYYHDQMAGQNSTYTILRPDNSVFLTWSFADTAAYYAASYWYWSRTIGTTEQLGEWTFRVNFQGNNYDHPFYILYPNTGVGELNQASDNVVYPNPASGLINVHVTGATQADIYTMQGVRALHCGDLKGQIDLSALPAAAYLVKVYGPGVSCSRLISKI